MTRSKIRLIHFGSAKSLTKATLPIGRQEAEEFSDKYV